MLTASTTGGLSSTASASSLSAALGGYVALSDLLQFVAFIVALVAFVRWRRGVKIVSGSARNFDLTSTDADPADRSEAGYRHSLYTTLLGILVTIIGGVALVAILLGNLTPTVNPNGTVTSPNSSQIQHAVAGTLPFLAGLTIVLVLVQLLLAYFVTESLDAFAALAGRTAELLRSPSPRLLVLVGVLFGATGVLNFVYPGAGAVAIAGPLLILWACQRYLTALAPGPLL